MERGGKVADVLQRIGMSPLAVIRTGMIQANMALLSSSRLQAHESEHAQTKHDLLRDAASAPPPAAGAASDFFQRLMANQRTG